MLRLSPTAMPQQLYRQCLTTHADDGIVVLREEEEGGADDAHHVVLETAMHITIKGGTAHEGDPPLCYTCRSASIARGPRLGDELVECHTLESRITFPVTYCTRYVNRQHPSVHDMEEIAWILRTDATRQRIGFVQPKPLPWKERFLLDNE